MSQNGRTIVLGGLILLGIGLLLGLWPQTNHIDARSYPASTWGGTVHPAYTMPASDVDCGSPWTAPNGPCRYDWGNRPAFAMLASVGGVFVSGIGFWVGYTKRSEEAGK